MTILRVALDVPLPRLFDYLDCGSGVGMGQRVLVPFGRRKQIGIVIEQPQASEVPAEKLKHVLEAFPDEPPLPREVLDMARFCASYYHHPLGQALLGMLPSRLREARRAELPQCLNYRLAAGFDPAVVPARATSQHKLLEALRGAGGLDGAALDAQCPGWPPVLRKMMQRGWVVAEPVSPLPAAYGAMGGLPLNADQQSVLEALSGGAGRFAVWLLHGVTGSGKTEVYMRLLEFLLATPGAQVLVLVPEINLTPQLESRFRSRFPQLPIVMLHSRMNESERLHGWLRAQNREARIVIGTRLSVFTPLPGLAGIVVDEEHDASYKQQDGMRYSARDVAVMRGKMAGVPVVLGSATPSLESWHHACGGRYHRLTLGERAVALSTLPRVTCIDARSQVPQDGLSAPLVAALRERLARGEQSLIFINRRGYAPVLLCSQCAWVAPCARCSARLVVHLAQKRLRCHHCGHEQRIPAQCPGCGNPDLHLTGQGTQRLEQALAQRLPQARIQRVDRDSMARRRAMHDMLARTHAGDVDILVGTQMLAKGHDFPNLTLVGVVETDSALFSPDYRASERLFSQLMQVAGRAGRAQKSGEVLIQTAFPEHPLFHALQRHDFAEFASALLEERKLAQFPPWCFEALLRVEAADYARVQAFMTAARGLAEPAFSGVTVYDPVRPQMARLKGMERAQLLVQSVSRAALQKFLQAWVEQLRGLPQAGKVRWSVDVDPLEY